MTQPEHAAGRDMYERMPIDEVGHVLISPSGGGKTTLRNYVCSVDPAHFTKYLPLTTRQRRPGEKPGQDDEYRFVTLPEMEHARSGKNVIFGNNSYGNDFLTLWPEKLPESSTYLYIYLPKAAVRLKETFPNTRIIQIVPSSITELEERITRRDPSIRADELQRRLAAVEEELTVGASVAGATLVNIGGVQESGNRLLELLRGPGV